MFQKRSNLITFQSALSAKEGCGAEGREYISNRFDPNNLLFDVGYNLERRGSGYDTGMRKSKIAGSLVIVDSQRLGANKVSRRRHCSPFFRYNTILSRIIRKIITRSYLGHDLIPGSRSLINR